MASFVNIDHTLRVRVVEVQLEVARIVQELLQASHTANITPTTNLYLFCAQKLEAKLRQRRRIEKASKETKARSRKRTESKMEDTLVRSDATLTPHTTESLSAMTRGKNNVSGVATGVACGMQKMEPLRDQVSPSAQGCTPKLVKEARVPIIIGCESTKCLYTLEGHTEPVTCCFIHGRLLITGSIDSTIKLWNIKNGSFLLELECGHPVYSLVFLGIDDDKFMLLPGCDDGNIPTWLVEVGDSIKAKCTTILPCHTPNPIRTMALSPDGRFLASGCCFFVHQITKNCQKHLSIRGTLKTWQQSVIRDCSLYPEKNIQLKYSGIKTMRQLASFFDPIRVQASSRSTDPKKTTVESDVQLGIRALAYTPDSKRLLVGFGAPVDVPTTNPKKLLMCCAETLQSLWVLEAVTPHINGIVCLAPSSGGQDELYHAIVSSQRHVERIAIRLCGNNSIVAGKPAYRSDAVWSEHFSAAHHGVWPCYNDLVATATGNTLRLWDCTNGQEVSVFTGHQDTIISASWDADSQYICTGSLDCTAKIWVSPTYSKSSHDATSLVDGGVKTKSLHGHGSKGNAPWYDDCSSVSAGHKSYGIIHSPAPHLNW